MKIGLVLECFDPRKGGLEQWTSQFARRLTDAGHDVHVIACEFSPPDSAIPLTFHPVKNSSSPILRAAALERALRALQLDVIHDMGCGWHADVFHPHGGSALAFRDYNLMRIPRWRQFRLWQEKRYREQRVIEKRQHSKVQSRIVAVSQMVHEHFCTLHRLPRERIHLIYNGVDTAQFSPQYCARLREPARSEIGSSGEEVIFLFVAHNLRLKNAEAAIKALARLIAEDAKAHLLIVGGKKPQPFVRLAKKLGLSRNVTFVEPVEDVRPYYAAADVHLHPTWYDPCSLVALEALACGLPLITTRHNGVSEMMTDGVEGFVVANPADVVTLGEKMRKLLDPALRARMGLSARQLAGTHTFERQTEQFLALYQQVAGN